MLLKVNQMYSLLKKSPCKWSLVTDERGIIKVINGFNIYLSINLLLSQDLEITCFETQVSNISIFKGRTFFSDAVMQGLSLLHSFAIESLNSGSAHCRWVQISDKILNCLIYLNYWKTVCEKDAKVNMNSVELKFEKLKK